MTRDATSARALRVIRGPTANRFKTRQKTRFYCGLHGRGSTGSSCHAREVGAAGRRASQAISASKATCSGSRSTSAHQGTEGKSPGSCSM